MKFLKNFYTRYKETNSGVFQSLTVYKFYVELQDRKYRKKKTNLCKYLHVYVRMCVCVCL